VNENEKKGPIKTNGLPKILFTKYYDLPGILSERLFSVMDINNNGFIDLKEFVNGMVTLFYEDFDKNSLLIFNFYDFDRDGKISKEDIRTILSYIPLNELNYEARVQSQEELFKILENCFSAINSEFLSYSKFIYIIENINSDIYLLLYLFLLQKKPFTKANINNYIKDKSKSPSKQSPKKLIASPSRNSNFSPYILFKRKDGERRSSVKTEKSNLNKKMLINSPIKFQRTGIKRNSVHTKEEIIELNPIENNVTEFDENEKEKEKEKEKNFKQLKIHKNIKINNKERYLHQNSIVDKNNNENNTNNNIEENIKIIPAYKQEKDFLLANENSKSDSIFSANKKRDENDEKLKDQIFFEEEFEDEEEEKEEEQSSIEGYLYKYINDKMKQIWFKLIHKDLYYFKDKNDKHKGMHNLSGLFLNEEGIKKYDNKKFYGFSITFPSKKRLYYVNNEEDYKKWIEKLKIATGYTNLLDIYEVKKKLGNGKFGLVKLGVNKKTGEKVAIKMMSKKNMEEKDFELLRTEVEILKICQHPYIIKLYELFENVDYFYITMEYCSGGNLFNYLEHKDFVISEDLACKIMHKLCTAVYYIHSYGITHRDLKPENILIANDKDPSDIRILDFGLSKIIGPDEKCTEPYGTLTFCAPEILLDKPYTKIIDLWSLGIISYLLLTGNLPFNGDSEQDIAFRIAYDQPNYEIDFRAKSKESYDFTKKLLEKNPKRRMNIVEALEHKWFKKYNKDVIIGREMCKELKGSTFEFYSSDKKSQNNISENK
jgi:Ca2+-binding EF-hand superfamily protein